MNRPAHIPATTPGPATAPRQRHGTARGFTLMELMVCMTLLALLASVALPSLGDAWRKARRTEALVALALVQLAQEHWRGANGQYSSQLQADPSDPASAGAALGLSPTTPGGLYRLSLSDADASGYTVAAVAVPGRSQAADGRCAQLALRVERGQLRYASCAQCSRYTFAASDRCWGN